jgi:MoxR-like ATPase
MTHSSDLYDALTHEMGTVLVDNEDAVEGLLVALLTRGHVLLEGVPGVAKTTIATLFAATLGLEHARIQMTPDVLPADITGTQVYRQTTGEFETVLGPVFANVVVADEINRATPKTQSALLEAMAERQVTIEGETSALPSPFLLVATQNPVEMEGTYDLPKAQRDRFAFKLVVDLPDRETERELLDRFDERPDLGPAAVGQVVTRNEILRAREEVAAVHVDDRVKEYILDVVAATRTHPDVAHGASPRASLAFLTGAKARAAIHGREYALPDDVKAVATSVLVHRLGLDVDADLAGLTPEDVVADLLESVGTPDETPDPDPAARGSVRSDD